MRYSALICLSLALPLAACGSKKPGTAQENLTSCRSPLLVDATSGACHLRVVSPKTCELVDLSGGRQATFSWTSDGSLCGAPFKVTVAGNPFSLSGQNMKFVNLNVGNGIDNYGGSITFSSPDLGGLTSTDGTFEVTIGDLNGSQPVGTVFRVKR